MEEDRCDDGEGIIKGEGGRGERKKGKVNTMKRWRHGWKEMRM
jgi:hypothetical protein